MSNRAKHNIMQQAAVRLLVALATVWLLLAVGSEVEPLSCDSERQIVNCGQLSLTTTEEQAAYKACCQENYVTPAAAAAEAVAVATAATVRQSLQPAQVRPDLSPSGRLSQPVNYRLGICTARRSVIVPTFSGTTISIRTQQAPAVLSKGMIQSIQNQAITWLATRPGRLSEVRNTFTSISHTNTASRFVHPTSISGPGELAAMKWRLSSTGFASPQPGAVTSLLSGTGIPPKVYTTNGVSWNPPTDCPVQGYYGPLPMQNIDIKYGGREGSASSGCHPNYPAAAPKEHCGHVSFVESDGQMAIKQAMAYWATGDTRYSDNALNILEAWATTNKVWGMQKENGPLEGGWGLASMSKALELLRHLPRGQQVLPVFSNWVNTVVMPVMDRYIFGMTLTAIANNAVNVYSNWHLTIADAMISFGVLTDDRNRYNVAVNLYKNATKDYLRWGRTVRSLSGIPRVPGECTETLRDIYHTQFGLGSALQAAEVAFQQGDDLYNHLGHAWAAAMELHARIILADRNKEQPPQGFKWYDDGKGLPAAPAGTEWRFDLARQVWYLMDRTTFQPVPGGELKDGKKYMVGVKFLPTGWEIGYNHYVGRLGLKMPQTQALLQAFAPEWWEMSWGLGTLAVADTAYQLWRPGMQWLSRLPVQQCTALRVAG